MLRVVQIGLGSIGRGIAERARLAGWKLAGAVDPAPDLVGRDVGELLGGTPLGIEVCAAAAELIDRVKPDVALHATGSHLEEIEAQFRPLLRRGLAVVSTCEELSYPFYRHPELSRTLDAEARDSGAVLLGTGVNPGFVMDKLVATLMASCDDVAVVRVSRIVDAGSRREPFQRKVGAGLTPAEFEARGNRLGHVGLAESAQMLGDAMRLGRQRTMRETLRPIVAESRVETEFLAVEPGQVAGIDQTATLEADGVERVRMALQMYVGAPQPQDAVSIEGSPPLEMVVTNGVPGDDATAALVIACAPLVRSLEPGLRTMLDLPLRPAFSRNPV